MEMKYGPIYHFPVVDDAPPITIAFIGINYCRPNYLNIRKNSRITVLGYVLSGRGIITLDDATFHPHKDGVFILPAGRYHQVSADPDCEEQWSYIWMNIDGDLAVRMLEAYKLSDSGWIGGAFSAKSLFQKAIQLAQSEPAEEMLNVLPVLFHQIVIRLSRTKNERNNTYSNEVRKIKSYLDGQIQSPFDSIRLCRHIGLSFRQINRLFKKESGMTVYNYVLMKKIDSAKMMLLDTELTVNEISERLGYADPHYFSNLFKRKTGCSPSNYRLHHKVR
jgi:AraC-like DNA-binding protein